MKGNLIAIIAYNWHHYITLLKYNDHFILIDDESPFEVPINFITDLYGGESNNKNKKLWQSYPRKWVARLLIYEMF